MNRKWIFWLLLAGFIWLVLTRLSEIEKLAKTLSQGQWEWVLVAALLQVLYYTILTFSYKQAFHTVEVSGKLLEMLPITFAALFLNVVAPVANVSGMALWADDAARRGQSPARATAGVLLQLIADFISFTLILIVGIIYLQTRHDLKIYEVTGAVILLLLTLGLSSILVLGLLRPDMLTRLLTWLQNTINRLAARLKRKPFVKEDWAERNSNEFRDASTAISRYPDRLASTIGVTFVGSVIDIASLYALFLAFHQPVHLGVLIAGFSMGILFWIVSPLPQGIGVVEGIMALVFTSLGVPVEVATTVSLAFRGLTFWLPLLIGFVILRSVKTFNIAEREVSSDWFETWSVRLVAILTGLMGVINVLSAVTPALQSRLLNLEQFSPLYLRHGSRLAAALAGFALILLSQGLWRRKRIAWLTTLVVLVISATSHMIKGLDFEEALLSLVLVGLLISFRHHFHARSDRPSTRQGLSVLGLAFVFTLGYGMLGFYLLDRHYRVNFDWISALRQTIVMFTQFQNPGLQPVTGFGRYFAGSIYIIALVTFTYAAWMLLRPVLLRDRATAQERARAKEIVERYGRSSLARFTLFDDKSYYFSPGGSVVAYAVEGNVAAALGDPIGPQSDLASAIGGFRQLCEGNDWLPAFYQTLPDTLQAYQAEGLDAIPIGQEGIVDLHTFSLEGKENKPVRNAYNHVAKAGYQLKIFQPPAPEEVLAELHAISNEWLTMMHGSEKRFSLGWFDESYLRSCPIAAVYSPWGQITAFANLVYEYQRNGTTVDLMRRRTEVESGTMDFLFVGLFQWARDQGCDTFDLGLSALFGVGEGHQDPIPERLMHLIFEHVNQFYNFKGLHEFKNKFHPQWSTRYLIYPNLASLPSVWMAVIRANSGDGELLPFKIKKLKLFR